MTRKTPKLSINKVTTDYINGYHRATNGRVIQRERPILLQGESHGQRCHQTLDITKFAFSLN